MWRKLVQQCPSRCRLEDCERNSIPTEPRGALRGDARDVGLDVHEHVIAVAENADRWVVRGPWADWFCREERHERRPPRAVAREGQSDGGEPRARVVDGEDGDERVRVDRVRGHTKKIDVAVGVRRGPVDIDETPWVPGL